MIETVNEAFLVLGLAPGDYAGIELAYRKLARAHHPDVGGDVSAMQRLNAARDLLERNPRLSMPATNEADEAKATPSKGQRRGKGMPHAAALDFERQVQARARFARTRIKLHLEKMLGEVTDEIEIEGSTDPARLHWRFHAPAAGLSVELVAFYSGGFAAGMQEDEEGDPAFSEVNVETAVVAGLERHQMASFRCAYTRGQVFLSNPERLFPELWFQSFLEDPAARAPT